MLLISVLYNKFRDVSIKQKLYICIICLIILPLLFTGLYLNNQFVNMNSIKSSETSLQILKQTNQSFNNLISDSIDLSIRILANDEIQKFASREYDSTLEYNKVLYNISNWMNDVIGSKTFLNPVCLSKNNKILYQTGRVHYEENPVFTKKAVEMAGEGFWTDEYELSYYSGSDSVISFFRGINDFSMLGKNIAVLRISIKEEYISSLYRDINPYKNGQIFLVNSAGRVLSSPNKDLIGKDFSNNDYVKKILQENEGFFSTNIDNQKNIVLFYTISETGWRLIETIPEKSFIPLKVTINMIIFIAVALCILFGVFFSLIQNEFLVNPVSRLLKEMNKLRKGNFDINIDIASKDEIGEMNLAFVEMAGQLKQRINDVYISKIKQREAELIALESQMNPHFLYNTLDSIYWRAVENKDYDVSEQIEALSEMFKHILNKGKEIVTIRDEINLVKNYLLIQKAKYGRRIVVNINVKNELMNCKTLKLILQPLVENAMLHGLEQKREGGTIEVKIEKSDNFISYTVIDNGIGVDEDRINQMIGNTEQSHDVFALKNIDERIKLKYGEEFGLRFRSKVGKGTQVEVLIPLIE